MTMSAKPLVNESDWELRREADEAIHYHVSGHWIAKRVTPESAPRRLYRAFYVGPDQSRSNEFPKRRKLHLAQVDALIAIRDEELKKFPRVRAIVAQRDGDPALALECVFDYIDEKFRELESDLDNRFEHLRISDS